jgi:8-hydroxy-5-deazaflavin:NADPH oxidoreductase
VSLLWRGPASLAGMVKEINRDAGTERVRVATPADVLVFGEVVLLAVPWRAREAWPQPEWVRGKIMIDAMNPYGPGGDLIALSGSTSSEEVAKSLPGARV